MYRKMQIELVNLEDKINIAIEVLKRWQILSSGNHEEKQFLKGYCQGLADAIQFAFQLTKTISLPPEEKEND